MKNNNRKLKHRLLHRIQINFSMLHNCAKFGIKESGVSSFYKENKFKPCLNKQLLNLFARIWRKFVNVKHAPQVRFSIRHLRNEKGTGAKMRPAIDSGIVRNIPEFVAKVNLAQSPSRF